MDLCRHFSIGVKGEVPATSENPLFSALACLFPVEFRRCTNGDYHDLDALILAGQDSGSVHCAAASGLPIFAVPAPPFMPVSARSAEFRLSESSILSACLRGYRFEEREAQPADTSLTVPGDEVVASQEGKPVWWRRRMEGAEATMVTWPLPFFEPGDHVHENFQSSRFLRLLPLLQFLRNLTCQADWQSPATTACLVVDDPNLHSKAYGHLNFQRLAAATREQGFYASIATVPLDSWWVDRQTREMFRKNAPRMSILLHGNDHTYHELARPASNAKNLSLLAQALRRSQRLQQPPGMEVCRVMECPHGSLSRTMLEPMARLGYEAVFASTAHLLRFNRDATFRASLGAERTLLERRAVPVIPRIRAESGWQTDVRLAAFLQQPIILAVHHWDFADDSHVAEDFARLVNSLPGVRWASPTGVSRSCYRFRQISDILHIKLDSRRVDISIPCPTRGIMIHRPWLQGGEEPELLIVRDQGNELFRTVSSADVVGPIPVEGRTALQVSSSLANEIDCNSVPPPPIRCWPLVRRLMAEVRDRSCVPVRLRRQARSNRTPERRRSLAGRKD